MSGSVGSDHESASIGVIAVLAEVDALPDADVKFAARNGYR